MRECYLERYSCFCSWQYFQVVNQISEFSHPVALPFQESKMCEAVKCKDLVSVSFVME